MSARFGRGPPVAAVLERRSRRSVVKIVCTVAKMG
jgi:hypothetical protein